MFRSETCSHQMVRCADHDDDRNMFILIIIETTFNHDHTKQVENVGYAEMRRVPNKSKIGPFTRLTDVMYMK